MMKNICKLALMAVCAICLAACSDNDSNNGGGEPDAIIAKSGVFILSEGNFYSGVNGDLTYYNPENTEYTNGVFAAVNNRALSGTANDGLVYGTKLYITNTDENVIEVVNAHTIKSIKQIELNSARCIVADGKYIYVTSFYGGEVAKIDTTSLEVVAKVKVEANPEGMAILDGKLYVANSGYGIGNTVSKIDLAKFQLEENITVATNPAELITDGSRLFVLCSGKYTADFSNYEENPAIYEILADGTTDSIAEATIATLGNDCIYLINNNYFSTSGITYTKLTLANDELSTWTLTNLPFSPYAMAVNPQNGDVYITSHSSKEGDGYVYADYEGNGYTMRFDKNGSQLGQFVSGVSAGTIIFF